MIPQLVGALLLAFLLSLPAAAAAGDDAGQDAEVTSLALASICTDAETGLHRFQVRHVGGPATEFTVRLVGDGSEQSFYIEPEGEQFFWVPAASPGTTEVEWPDGIVSAAQGDASCEPVTASEAPPSEPSSGSSPPELAAPEPPESAVPEPPGARTTAPDQPSEQADPALSRRDEAQTLAPATEPAGAAETPSSAVAGTRDRPRAADEPAPTAGATSSEYGCPRGWVLVDSNADGLMGEEDRCEPVIATNLQGGTTEPEVDHWLLTALGITLLLLLLTVGAGPALIRARR